MECDEAMEEGYFSELGGDPGSLENGSELERAIQPGLNPVSERNCNAFTRSVVKAMYADPQGTDPQGSFDDADPQPGAGSAKEVLPDWLAEILRKTDLNGSWLFSESCPKETTRRFLLNPGQWLS